jgi:DNA-binding response OmpR family regulator
MTMPATLEEAYEEIRNLRRDLGIDAEYQVVAKIHAAMHLSPQQARMVAAMWRRGDRVTTNDALISAMNCMADETDGAWQTMKVQISKINSGKHGKIIRNVWGKGYFLTAEARDLIDRIVAEPKARRIDPRGQEWTMQGNMGVSP